MVEVHFEDDRGRAVVLFAGNFKEAKAWARSVAGARVVRAQRAKWLSPATRNVRFLQHKAAGEPDVFPWIDLHPQGPVAFRWFPHEAES